MVRAGTLVTRGAGTAPGLGAAAALASVLLDAGSPAIADVFADAVVPT